jgi:hypothetical protein
MSQPVTRPWAMSDGTAHGHSIPDGITVTISLLFVKFTKLHE